MARLGILLNNDLFEVDADEYHRVCVLNTKYLNEGTWETDWVRVTEWVELHGEFKGAYLFPETVFFSKFPDSLRVDSSKENLANTAKESDAKSVEQARQERP